MVPPNAGLSPLRRARVAVAKKLVPLFVEVPIVRQRLARKRGQPVDGRMLDDRAAALLALDDVMPFTDIRKMSLAGARATLAESIAMVESPPPSDVVSEDRYFRGLGGDVRVRLYAPLGMSGTQPAVAYFHGGGFVTGSADTHDVLTRKIARGAKCRVFSFDYRLAPENPFPAAVDDGLSALRWMFENAASLGIDASRVAVAGDSAGGNLSAVLSLRMRNESPRPMLQVLLYPAIDGACTTPSHRSCGEGFLLTSEVIDWYYDQYVGPDKAARLHPDVSPIYAPDVSGAAPALIYPAGLDPLRDDSYAYAKKLRAAGVEVSLRELDTMMHGFACVTGALDVARHAVDVIVADIRNKLHATA